MQIKDNHLKIIKGVLNKYPYKFYLFGSRANGEAREFSDLDLCYKEPISDSIIVLIEEEFEESNLPYKVDFVSWSRCSFDFKNSIRDSLVQI